MSHKTDRHISQTGKLLALLRQTHFSDRHSQDTLLAPLHNIYADAKLAWKHFGCSCRVRLCFWKILSLPDLVIPRTLIVKSQACKCFVLGSRAKMLQRQISRNTLTQQVKSYYEQHKTIMTHNRDKECVLLHIRLNTAQRVKLPLQLALFLSAKPRRPARTYLSSKISPPHHVHQNGRGYMHAVCHHLAKLGQIPPAQHHPRRSRSPSRPHAIFLFLHLRGLRRRRNDTAARVESPGKSSTCPQGYP